MNKEIKYIIEDYFKNQLNETKIITNKHTMYNLLNAFLINCGCMYCPNNDTSHNNNLKKLYKNSATIYHFHHITSSKLKEVKSLLNDNPNTLLREINKCTVLCANCHSYIHSHHINSSLLVKCSDKFKQYLIKCINDNQKILNNKNISKDSTQYLMAEDVKKEAENLLNRINSKQIF